MSNVIRPDIGETKRLLVEQLGSYDRMPFVEQLATLMLNGPSADDWRKFAKKFPDRWVSALATLSRTAGFSDKTEAISLNVHAHLHTLSDVDLHARLREMTLALAAPNADALSTDDTITVIPHTDGNDTHTDDIKLDPYTDGIPQKPKDKFQKRKGRQGGGRVR